MTWALEALRGTLSSLVAPAVLLAAALIVAIGGSGADALSSLAQLTKGPEVPPTPVDMVSRDARVGPDVGQLEGRLVASAGVRSAQVTQGSPSPAQGSSSSAPSAAGGSGGASAPSPAVSRAPGSSPSGGSSGQGGAQPGTTPSASAPSPPPSSSSPAPSRPNPVGDALDQTRQLGSELLKPVAPITDQLLGGLRR